MMSFDMKQILIEDGFFPDLFDRYVLVKAIDFVKDRL
jgi:hypothetical protein